MKMKSTTDAVKKLYTELDLHLLSDEKPAEFLIKASKLPEFSEYPFSMLLAMQKTEQSPVHHPEGNVWNHTLLVVNEAAKRRYQSKNPRVFMWAAMLHDIGKPLTTKMVKGKLTAYSHDIKGAELAREFLSAFEEDEEFISKVVSLVRYHMQLLFVLRDMPFKDISGIIENSDATEIALLGLCDRLGRTGANRESIEEQVRTFIQKCDEYREGRTLDGEGGNEKTRS